MAAASGRVLVVDDSEVIRQLIKVNLELEGFEVVTAADGAECLEVVRGVAPDVVTLDVVMPRLDGLRTAARLRASRDTAHLPIAIVSACTPADLERGESVGVDGYLAKPFDPAELVALVRRLRASAGPGGRRFAYDFGSPPSAGPALAGPARAATQTPRDSALGEQAQELVRPDDPRP
ncbi:MULTISPECIES: response regulator [Kitasatospora]|uniref:Putative response regulator n=1 Tax=Kitasatospora setae (strain ATCC 33774 / DSM 43861 / JCM 3304 / KCC A-0304 / NBRC 14216 / KM-6054) TaxID=452652 RepID=E4NGZ5_KITSK|nr:response regulator [Kitasatospora setae]BAJ30775.1 putative response regulator [Kitasatospora setae KM-6054]